MAEILTDSELKAIEAQLKDWKPPLYPLNWQTCAALLASHRALAAERDSSVDKERELALKLVLLTEERDKAYLCGRKEACDENHAHWNGLIESFRERAVRAIRGRAKDYEDARHVGGKSERARRLLQERSMNCDSLASLVESLPLEPEQEEKL